MDYLVTIFKKETDNLLIEAKASEDGVLAIMRRFSSLNKFDQATFMHDLRQTGTAHILYENELPFEIIATKD